MGIYAGSDEMWDANDDNVPVQEHTLAWEEAALAFDGGVRYWTSPPAGGGGAPDTSNSDSGAVYNQATGFTQVVAQDPNNSLDNYWDMAGQPWSAGVIVGPGTAYSDPTADYNQSTGFTQVFAEGANAGLDNYWDWVGQPWSSGVVVGPGTSYSDPATVYNQSSGFTQVFAQGTDYSLDNYWDNYGRPWSSGVVAGAGATSQLLRVFRGPSQRGENRPGRAPITRS